MCHLNTTRVGEDSLIALWDYPAKADRRQAERHERCNDRCCWQCESPLHHIHIILSRYESNFPCFHFMNYAYQCSINQKIKLPQKVFLKRLRCFSPFRLSYSVYCQTFASTDFDVDSRWWCRIWNRCARTRRKSARLHWNTFWPQSRLSNSEFPSLLHRRSLLGRAPAEFFDTFIVIVNTQARANRERKAHDEEWQVKWAQWNFQKKERSGKNLHFSSSLTL